MSTEQQHDVPQPLRGRVEHWLAGEPLHGSIARAGLPKTMREIA